MRKRNTVCKYGALFLVGGFAYGLVENLSRGYSHISMFLAGGLCFILIGLINEVFPEDISLVSQMLISSIIITVVEFVTGVIVNLRMGLHVWDYSSLPYNIYGQVCLPFSIIWFFLSLLAIFADDYIRYKFMGEEKPHYKVL